LYDHFIQRYAPIKEVNVLGDTYYNKITTSKMDTKQMTDFVENVRMFSMDELNIYLPLPNENGYNEFYEKYYKYIIA